MRTIPITLMALAALLLLPVGAMGQGTLPPDNAAIDEYVEGVPGPTGKKPSSGVKGGGSGDASGGGSGGGSAGGPGAGALPTGVVTTLQSLGSDGQAVADLALTAGSGPSGPGARPQGNGGDGDGDGGGGAADVADRGGAGSEVEQIVGQTLGAGTAGGMGVLLPLILVVALVGAVVAALQRRRRSGTPE